MFNYSDETRSSAGPLLEKSFKVLQTIHASIINGVNMILARN